MLELKPSEDLIIFMKSKNIKFEDMSEDDAIIFLENNTYYKKISSYQKNFHTYIKDGKEYYSNLDFAYLRELSTLDMHIRMLAFKICVNIEHSVKIQIINKCIQNNNNGYDIIDEFFNKNKRVKDSILMNASNSYCTELIITHQNHFPLWVVLEVISFGDLCHLFKFLSIKGYFNIDISDILFQVHDFRNAAAHNHCLLHNLKPCDNVQPKKIIS